MVPGDGDFRFWIFDLRLEDACGLLFNRKSKIKNLKSPSPGSPFLSPRQAAAGLRLLGEEADGDGQAAPLAEDLDLKDVVELAAVEDAVEVVLPDHLLAVDGEDD